jgi:RNA polymerase sigma factor (sigma-70 family)
VSPSTEFEDDALVIAASIDEPDRFRAIFDRHAQLIDRFLTRRVGREVAEDLLAEVFLAAFRRRARYDARYRDARPWLYGIAANVVGQHRRDEARRWRLLAAVPSAPDEVNPVDEADSRVVAAALRAPLVAGLRALSRPDREVLLMAAWEQLTYDEIATAMQTPIGTVRSRLSRARRQLRTHLGDQDPRSPDTSLEELLANE